MLPLSQLRPDRVLPDTGSTVLGVNKHGKKRIISAQWSRTKKLWGSRTRSTLHHQETSEHIQPTKSVGNLGTTSARPFQLIQALALSSMLLLGRSCTPLKDPRWQWGCSAKTTRSMSRGYQSTCNSHLYWLNNVPSVRVAHCSLPSST